MAALVAETWGKVQAWFTIDEKRKFLERTAEWVLALAWPIVAYQVVFNRYGWKSDYYNRWNESWFALVLLVAMAAPLVLRLFSGNAMELPKRVSLLALIAVAVALAVQFRPNFGGVTFSGFFIPMGLYAVAGLLWLRWRSKKAVPVIQS